MALSFLTLKQRTAGRLKLSSSDALSRLGEYINERYRAVATSCGLTAVRFGTANLNTAIGTTDYSPATVVHPITITYPAGNRVLLEKTKDFLRNLDPGGTQTGAPQYYVIKNYNASTVTLEVWPKPDAIYALVIDGILAGTELTGDGDVPVLPEDFVDVLIFGACADELIKLEKPNLSMAMEAKYTKRLSELRYFVAKTAYLDLRQGEQGNWWWGWWWSTYRG